MAVPVSYFNLPPEINLASDLPDTLIISLTGKGWKFLSGNLFTHLSSLTIDLSFLSRQHSGVVAHSAYRFVSRIPEFNSPDVKILRIEPDTIRFFLSENYSVRVPVKADVFISFKKQYMIAGDIKILPDSISVFGSLQAISALTSITTSPVKLEMVSATVDTLAPFHLPQGVRCNLKKQQVRILIPVAEFAEKQFSIPVRPSPNMTGRFKFYPETALLTIRIPLSRANHVNASDFTVIAEMHSPSAKHSRLICEKLPPDAELFQLYPPYVETYNEN